MPLVKNVYNIPNIHLIAVELLLTSSYCMLVLLYHTHICHNYSTGGLGVSKAFFMSLSYG